jgi:hypothetical protein
MPYSSLRLLTAKKRVQSQGNDLGLVVEKVALKKILRVPRFVPTSYRPIPILSHPRLVHLAAAVPRDSLRQMNKIKMKSVNKGKYLC